MSAFVENLDVRTGEAANRFSRVELCASVIVSGKRARIDNVAVSLLRERVRAAVEEAVSFTLLASPAEMKGGAE